MTGLVMGDWSFKVGSGGFDVLDPVEAIPVDIEATDLDTPLGGTRVLGRTVASGSGASATNLGSGLVQINGLASVPASAVRKWLHISGSSDTGLNGLWVVRQWISATSVIVYAPLATTVAGSLAWDLRSNCVMRPNDRSSSFQCVLPLVDATIDGQNLGEVGIFGRVIVDPLGLSTEQSFLFAIANHAAIFKDSTTKVTHHVVVQS